MGAGRFELIAKLALLAAVYYLTGKFGQSIAIPPGYATVIWPPSGIALGALLAHGRRMAPGVFVGSLLINLDIADIASAGALLPVKLLACVCIASGSTLQALAGHALVRRWFGLPLRLDGVPQVFRLFAIAGPLASLIAASIGVLSLHALGELPRAELLPNWFSWWVGDVFGIVVFLPLVMAIPLGGGAGVTWRDRALRGVHAVGLMLLVLPLGLTFYAWQFFADSAARQAQARFETLTRESEQAMQARLASYASAARSGAGVFQSSQHVSRAEWRRFAETMRLRDDYPGMMGLGWIERVPAAQKDRFLARVRADAAPDFRIHPQGEGEGEGEGESDGPQLDVVTYMEPEVASGDTLGLDISRDARRRAAAERAAATGLPTLTRPLRLLQDEERTPGFLLLQPVYAPDAPLDDAAARRQALRGFVYAPFRARDFVAGLVPGPARGLDIAIATADDPAAGTLFSSRIAHAAARFSARRDLDVFGQTWSVTWQSTPEFEQAGHATGALFVLLGGLLFTGLFAVLLVVVGARRPAVDAGVAAGRPRVLPMVTFALVAGTSVAAWAMLSHAEDTGLGALVDGETRRLEANLDRAARSRLQSLRRMAHRWETGGGTPYLVWRNDARDHVRQLDGLEELQWIGPDYRVQWAEGVRRAGWVENRDVRANPALARELEQSVASGLPLVTEPRETAPGESAFTVYIPMQRDGRFDGFLAGQFSSRGFFRDALDATAGDAFALSVLHGGASYFDNGRRAAANPAWTRVSGFDLNERRWTFEVSPTQELVDAKQTRLPLIVLLAGLLIALLSAILVRYVLIARVKAARIAASAAALAASDERYELAMRGMSVGLWDWDITTNALYWSERFKDIIGIPPGGFVPHYREFSDRLHPDDRARVEAALFGHLRGQGPYDIEFRMRRSDGAFVWVHSYGQARFDAQGHAVRMAGSVQDITEKHRQQQEIARSEAQMRLLVENTPAAVAMFDTQMRYLMVSRRWIEDYQLEGRDIIGVSHYDVFPEIRTLPRWIDIHQRALRGERFDNREDSWTRADGSQEYSQWAIHPWLDATGRVGGIVLFTEVITARKMAEAALRTGTEMIRAAMDKAPIGKALVRPDGRFLKVNPALCRLLGYSEAELLANDFQSITHPEDLDADLDNVRALVDGRIVSYQMEKRYFHHDGRLIWAQLSVSVVRKADGAADFLVAQVQDITERKAIGRIKDEFVSLVSHELRTPLAAIRASLERVNGMRDVEMPAEVRRLVDLSAANCERLAGLVDDILDLDRIASGHMRFDLADQSLAAITRRAVLACEGRARKHDVRIALESINPEIVVYVDAERFVQVLSNLLSNAVKFSPPQAEIEVGAELRGGSVRVFVRDHGAGIPEEFRGRIFGRFSQADSGAPRQQGGTGLGLHITRQLVERMHGTIGFVSEVGLGTTFWVEFPCVSPDRVRVRTT
jgi:PAS domain S-box-containing protein